MLNTPVVGYVWDNEAPKGWSGRSTQIGGDKMRYIVLRNKTDKTASGTRNAAIFIEQSFSATSTGRTARRHHWAQIHINTQRLKTLAEGLIGEIYFSSETKDVRQREAAKEKWLPRP